MSDDGGYAVVADPYCYAGTAVLKNIPGLRDQATVEGFETAITTQRAQEPLPSGRFSVSHYRAIHRHLFQDVYRWAGRFRTVRIAKEETMFCYPEHIAGEMRRLFGELRDGNYLRDLDAGPFSAGLAHFVAELNAIHPFRDGNGRTQLIFATVLAQRAGNPLVLKRLRPRRFLLAMIRSFHGDEGPLREEISRLIA
ncbi:MAG: Fic/DOC family protein [Hyphomicrobiales bacterium]